MACNEIVNNFNYLRLQSFSLFLFLPTYTCFLTFSFLFRLQSSASYFFHLFMSILTLSYDKKVNVIYIAVEGILLLF